MVAVHVVIHLRSPRHAAAQCGVAVDAGATSVFLIDHYGGGVSNLWSSVMAVRAAYPGLLVGVNHLGGGPPAQVMHDVAEAVTAGDLDRAPDALWCDDARGGARDESGAEKAWAVKRQLIQLADMTYFGGVAFKYTSSYTDEPAASAREAGVMAPFVDVVTTSGSGTNRSAPTAKVSAMQAALRGGRLALASGVSPENVADYAPFVSDVLVASSIETAPYSGELVPDRVSALVNAAKAT